MVSKLLDDDVVVVVVGNRLSEVEVETLGNERELDVEVVVVRVGRSRPPDSASDAVARASISTVKHSALSMWGLLFIFKRYLLFYSDMYVSLGK